ncbi:alpha/beta fold hydrolase, partial [Kitasatospora sp. NPDC001574]
MTQLPSAVSVRESGTGTPLVLLHAFPLNAAMWSSQLDELPGPTGDEARVIAPDQRGFGGTVLGTDEPSLDAVADDVALLLDAAGVDRAVLGGLSMGGYVALAVARRHPDRLAGLLLANTKATADTEAARANRERIASAVLARNSVRLLLDERMAAGQLGPDSQHLADRVQTLIAA